MRVVIDHIARRAYIGAERRGAHRQRVYKGAIITFNRGNSVFECLVRNQSDEGAKLCMEQAFGLPLSFALAITVDQTTRKARVMWRSSDALGVRFEDAPA